MKKTNNLKKNIIIFTNDYWLKNITEDCVLKYKNYKTIIVTNKKNINFKYNKNFIEIKYCKNLTLTWCKNNIPLNYEILLSIGSPWIFNINIINFFKNNLYNIHQSPLPKYRGGSLTSLIILKEIRALQISIHKITKKIDEGDIIFSEDIYIPSLLKTPFDINNYIQKNIREVSFKFLNNKIRKKETYNPRKQNKFFNYYVPRLKSDVNGWIDWSHNVYEIERFIRSFDKPYDGALTTLNSKKVRIRNIDFSLEDSSSHPFENGLILRKFMNMTVVSVKGGSIYIKDILDEKNNLILKINPGDKFISPLKYLEMSKKRVTYKNKNNIIYTKNFKIKK